MAGLDPTLIDAAQARYAEILSRIADRLLDGIRALIDSGDIAEVATLLAAAESAAIDVTAAHLEILTGTPAPLDTGLQSLADDLAEKIAAAPDQAIDLASKFVHQASAEEAQRFNNEAPDIKLWIRVTSPGDTCGLCVQAATRVYKRADLAPIHDHCRCTVQPLLSDVTTHKATALALAERVDDELAAAARKNGRTKTAKQSRSRAKNVRVTTPEPQS